MKSTLQLTCTLVLVASFASCRYQPPPVEPGATKTAAAPADQAAPALTQQQLAPALPAGHPAVGQLGATTVLAPVPAANLLTGRVAETMDAGGYTYIRLRGEQGEIWTAVRQVKLSKGDIVTIAAQMTMKDFESKSLNRKFDSIVFGTLAEPAGVPSAGTPNAAPAATVPAASMPPGHPMTGMPAMPGMGGMTSGASKIEPGAIKVAKADGAAARTVEELWASHTALTDKQVVVRGKVVKFLPEIMGKNWIHLQDGSGSREAGTNDITITTTDKAVAGDVVLVTGTVKTDVNFGAGYAYPVMIQDAKVTK